jgi:hypothetical protein
MRSQTGLESTSEPLKAHFSSLLSVDPVVAFQQELASISTLAYNFSFINRTICIFLSKDTHADALRALLEPFNLHTFHVANDFHTALARGQWFYAHNHGESKDPDLPDSISDEKAQRLLDPEFQSNAREYAMFAAAELESASQVLEREVLPCLPYIEEALKKYVDEYNSRHSIMQERSRSWVHSVLQDIIWGANDPTTWNIAEVIVLPDDFVAGAKNLKKLPELFDGMIAHFKQLGELEMSRVSSLGYTTIQDLHRLARDRLQCRALLQIMDNLWDPALIAFPLPLP